MSVAALIVLVALAVMPGHGEVFKKSVDAASSVAHPRLAPILAHAGGDVGDGNLYHGELLGATNASALVYAGQEVRLVVTTSFLANATHRNDLTGPFANLESRMLSTRIFQNQFYGRENWTSFPAFNHTGPSNVRVRVISAHSTRSSAQGGTIRCDEGLRHDVWSEVWGMAPRATAWGLGLVYSGFVTFTTPPFPFRVCIKDINEHNATSYNPDKGQSTGWREFRNWEDRRLFRPQPPLYLFSAGKDNQVGDYAAVSVFPHTNGVNRPNAHRFDPYAFSTFDHVKLVPAGLPCTFEKQDSSATRAKGTVVTSARDQYCGANMVNPATGNFIDSNCPMEGARTHSVAHVGVTGQNPLATDNMPHDWVASGSFIGDGNATGNGTWLVGYTHFAEAGDFDVCVSTRAYRWNSFNASQSATLEGGYARNARPLWFKAYNANTSACETVAHTYNIFNSSCAPTNASLFIADATADVTWDMSDRRAGSWGEIKFTTARAVDPLQSTPATRWEHSVPRDYAYLDGGDQFRLVHVGAFAAPAAQTDFGEVYKKSDGSTFKIEIVTSETSHSSRTKATVNRIETATRSGSSLFTAGQGATKQYWLGTPGLGTQLSSNAPGCFFSGDDNYGSQTSSIFFGAPEGQCCSPDSEGSCTHSRFCTMSDNDWSGPTASADLGGAPRTSYSPWTSDSSSTTDAYGFIRVPAGGTYYVCYRRPGGNWRVARSGVNHTFAVTTPSTHLSYYINDTSADSWGQWRVTSTKTDLKQRLWNYYTSPSAAADGSALKIVLDSQSCYLDTAQPRSFSMRPAAAECLPDQAAAGAACRGAAFTSTTATAHVYFFMKVPNYLATTARYRVCFRQAALNWVELGASSFVPHTYMASATRFHPLPPRGIAFRLDDRREGTLGVMRFSRRVGFEPTTAPLNAQPVGALGDGDMMRLLPNTTGDLGCDLVFASTVADTTDLRAKEYNASLSSTDLGLVCNSTTTGDCAAAVTMSTDGGIVGSYPYTDLSLASDARIIAPYDGTAAVLEIPARRSVLGVPQAWKVCYKQAGRNWIEALDNVTGSPLLQPAAPPTHQLSATSTPLIAGAYAHFDISVTDTNDAIEWSVAAAKLVEFGQACTANPAGSGSAENAFTASAGFSDTQRGGGYIVDATSDATIVASANTVGNGSVVRAFIPLPTSNVSTPGTANYRFCFLSRRGGQGTDDVNWQDLSGPTPVSVSHLGVVYTAESQPRQNSPLRLRFTSTVRLFRTDASGDAAKVVGIGQPCTSNDTVAPWPVDSSNLALGGGASGVTDLGPQDELRAPYATADVTVPVVAFLKVCFKPAGLPWIEVDQDAEVGRRVFSLSGPVLAVTAAQASSVDFDASVIAQGPYSGQVLGGATSNSGSALVTVTLSAAATLGVQYDEYKIVRLVDEYGAAVPEASCTSNGVVTGAALTPAASTSVTELYFNFPTRAGRYVFCYRREGAQMRWEQVPSTSSAHGNPFSIASTAVSFSVPSTASATGSSRVTVVDEYSNATSAQQGSLAGADYIYFTNATDGCGYNTSGTVQVSINNTVVGSSYVPDDSSLVATRATDVTALPGAGSWRVCYYKSQAASTNASTMPFVKAGHYQLPNAGTSFGAFSDYLVFGEAASIVIDSCPGYNSTYRIPTGRSFRIAARLVDAAGNLVPLSRVPVRLYGASGSTWYNSLGTCDTNSAAAYGRAAGNLVINTENGVAEFDAALVSSCAATGCKLQFSASIGTSTITAASTCNFGVLPTVVGEIATVSFPSECALGQRCRVKAVAYHLDRTIAYASTDAVTVGVAGGAGLSVQAFVGTQLIAVNEALTARFHGGSLEVDLVFQAASFSALNTITGVDVRFTANQVTSSSVTITVHKPIVTAVHIVDIYPIAFGGVGIHPLSPAWEPAEPAARSATYFTGNLGGRVDGSGVVSAAPGFHLVAGQFYTAVLRAVARANGGPEEYVTTAALINSGVSIGFDHGTLNAAGNVIISTEGCVSEFECQSNFSAVSFTQPKQDVTFRLMNSRACSRAAGGCNVTFLFNGQDIAPGASTAIVTPVRSIATRLRASCSVAGSNVFTEGACPVTAINVGWDVRVEAVDDWGDVDEFFDGALFARAATSSPASFSVVDGDADVANGVTQRAFSAGVAMVYNFTTARACVGCAAEFISDWGANLTGIGGMATTNPTERIECSVATPIVHCAEYDADFQCLSVGERNLSTSTSTLLYPDTTICVDVTAVDGDGRRSAHQTNWVYYAPRSPGDSAVGNNSVTLTDDRSQSGFVQRYRPLEHGHVRFCFKATPALATSAAVFHVDFAAQQFGDANYWSRGSGGRCAVGPFTVVPKKMVAGLSIASVTGLRSVGAVLAASKQSAADILATVTFAVRDHYNATITGAASLVDADAASSILLVTDTATAQASLSTFGSTAVRGELNVTAATPMVPIAAPSVALTVSGYGFPHTLTFVHVDGNGTALRRATLAEPANTTALVEATHAVVVLNGDPAATRRVGFYPGESPLRHWASGDATTQSASPPPLHNSSCWTDGAGCLANASALLDPYCDDGAGTLVAGAANAPIRMAVFVVDPTAGAFDETLMEPLAGTQVDVLSNYTVAFSVGAQTLICDSTAGSACEGDMTTAPSQVVTALASTLEDVAAALTTVTDAGLPATRFAVYGGYPSDQASFDAVTRSITRSGSISASVTGSITVTPLSTGDRVLGWAPAKLPQSLSLLDIAADNDTCVPSGVSCHTLDGSGGCAFNGVARRGSFADVAFNYSAQDLHAGIPVPITIDLVDADGARAWFASGSFSATLLSASGCGDGGTVEVSSAATANGRGTLWVTLSGSCQGCRLRFTFTPDATQLADGVYSVFEASPALWTVSSRPINVLPSAPGATHAVMTSTALPPAMLTVATPVTASFESRSTIGRYAFPSTAAVTVAAYNTIPVTERNWWWYGNGGVLRPTLDASPHQHHSTTVTTVAGAATLTAYFTKTCRAGCGITFAFLTAGGQYGAFPLKNALGTTSFTVTTAPTKALHVGFVPRFLLRSAPNTLSFWEVGSEATASTTNPVEVAGVASDSTGTFLPSTVTSTALDSTSGDGGRLITDTFSSVAARTLRFAFSLPCTRCAVSAGPFSKTLVVAVEATHLRPVFQLEADAQIVTARGSTVAIALRALDDEDTVDPLFGQVDCTYSAPFFCKTPADAAVVTTEMSADGISPGGFVPFSAVMTAINNATLVPAMTADRLVGGRGTVSFALQGATRGAVPIFTSNGISSALTASRAFPVPEISIPAGTLGLQLAVDDVPELAPVGIAVSFDVAVISPTSKVVASTSSHAVSVTPSATCPTFTMDPPAGFALQRGYRRVSITFDAAATSLCTITFSASGAGCSACSADAVMNVSQPSPTGWEFVRPTPLDNLGAAAGPMYGAGGRRTFVTVQLFHSRYGPVGACPTCVLAVGQTFKDGNTLYDACSFSVTGGTFNVSGRATVEITFAPHSSLYKCSLNAQVRVGASLVPWLTTGLSTAFPDVEICTPAAIRFRNNASALYRGQMLHTAVAYPFDVDVVDAAGNLCRGDSMDDATQLAVSTVDAAAPTRDVSSIVPVVNVNTTGTATAAFIAGSYTSAFSVGRSARVIAGSFRFSLVFAASSVTAAALTSGFRVKVSCALGEATSGRLDSDVAATVLRPAQGTRLPTHAVLGQNIVTGPLLQSQVAFEAVDELPSAWIQLGLVSAAPNVATRESQRGSTGSVALSVDPRPEGVSPLAFAPGESADGTLTGGRVSWSSLTWNRIEGEYRFSAVPALPGIRASPPTPIIFQRSTSVRFISATGATCSQDCVLGGFATGVDTTTGTALLTAPDITVMTVTVTLADSSGRPVLGEERSVVQLSLQADPRVTAKVAAAPDYGTTGPFFARVERGQAVFNVGFTGSTASTASLSGHLFARLEVSCPALRPANLRVSGEPAANPCAGASSGQSRSLRLESSATAASEFNTPIVLANRRTFKLRVPPSAYRPLSVYRSLGTDTVAALHRQNGTRYSYLSAVIAKQAMPSTPCAVDEAFGSSDLGTSVCRGATVPTCSFEHGNVGCPSQVITCDCNASYTQQTLARSLLRRSLLQLPNETASSNSTNASRVAIELFVDLQRAPAFRAGTTFEVAAEYRAVQEDLETVLRNDAALQARYGYNASDVATWQWNAVLSTALPPSALTPPPTGQNSSAMPTLPFDDVSAAPVRGSVYAVFAALVALAVFGVVA